MSPNTLNDINEVMENLLNLYNEWGEIEIYNPTLLIHISDVKKHYSGFQPEKIEEVRDSILNAIGLRSE